MNPEEKYRKIAYNLPRFTKVLLECRRDKGVVLPDWPEHIFLADEAWVDISKIYGMSLDWLCRAQTIATWGVTKGIYSFDATLQEELISTPIEGKLRSEAFRHLPEWSTYIKTEDMSWCGKPLHGFWTSISLHHREETEKLNIVLNTGEKIAVMSFHLGDWTISEMMDRTFKEVMGRKSDPSMFTPSHGIHEGPQVEYTRENLGKLLSLVLYLTAKPEFDASKKPGISFNRPTLTNKDPRRKAMKNAKVKTFRVGTELGKRLRESQGIERTHTAGHTKRPHLRRGHWHGYWKGPRDGERQYIHHWIPPMITGGKELQSA